MFITIENLFEKIRVVSKQNRKQNHNFDGKEFWQPIKAILSTSNWTANKWKTQSKNKYNEIMSIPEFIINGFGNTEIIEQNHFLIQTVRIPQNEKPSLRKVCQIALNIGQYQGHTGKSIEHDTIQNFLLKTDINIQLNDILSKNKIVELELLLKK